MKCLVLTKLTTTKKRPNKFIKKQYEASHQMKHPQLKCKKYEGAKKIAKCQKDIAISSP
jgi:hypothetical protein